jgi:hypothetical protein
MIDYASLPDPEAADLISTRVRQWDEEEHVRYAALGLMVQAVAKRMLWRHVADADGLPCRSLARWIHFCAPRAYSTCYQAMRDVEELSDVPAEDLAQIPHANIQTMKKMSGGVRKRPEVLAAAKTQRKEAFVETIKRTFPGQHLEQDAVFRVPLNETQLADVEGALAKAMARGCASRSEALWMIAVDYIASDSTILSEVEDGKCGHA